MTRQAIEVLCSMRDGEEFVYDRGFGYVGNRRVKQATKILMELIHANAIMRVEMPGCSAEYFRISPGDAGSEREEKERE